MAKYINKLLESTFLELAKEEKVNDITVSQLVTVSEINRKTFYNHYSGIGNLACNIMENLVRKSITETPTPANWEAVTCSVLQLIRDNASLCLKLRKSKYWPEIELKIKELMKQYVTDFVDNAVITLVEEDGERRTLEEKDKQYVVTFYSTMMLSMITLWVENGMKEPIPEYVSKIGKLCNNGVFAGIEEFKVSGDAVL